MVPSLTKHLSPLFSAGARRRRLSRPRSGLSARRRSSSPRPSPLSRPPRPDRWMDHEGGGFGRLGSVTGSVRYRVKYGLCASFAPAGKGGKRAALHRERRAFAKGAEAGATHRSRGTPDCAPPFPFSSRHSLRAVGRQRESRDPGGPVTGLLHKHPQPRPTNAPRAIPPCGRARR